MITSITGITSGQLNSYSLTKGFNGAVVPDKISTMSITAPLTDFVPSAVNTSTGLFTNDSRYEQMISFDLYDIKNNLTGYQARNDSPVSVFWSHNYALPVAQIQNAVAGAIAYTSFEADAKGNWTYSGTPSVSATAPSGTMAYPLSGGSVTSSSLSTSTAYTLTYWSNGGAATISGAAGLTTSTIRSANGWTLYMHKISAGTSTITLSGAIAIDELRLYPAMDQMITYAYNANDLVSTFDAKGQATNYEYDPAQRLKNVRDWLGNIVSNTTYHNYDMTVGNDAISSSFTRNDCPSGSFSGSALYSIPAAKYFSSTKVSANAEALYDLNKNGQLYANKNCSCTAGLTFTLSNATNVDGFRASFSGLGYYDFRQMGSATITIPPGTYNITVNPINAPTNRKFTLNGGTPVVAPGVTFNSIVVSASTPNTLTIQTP